VALLIEVGHVQGVAAACRSLCTCAVLAGVFQLQLVERRASRSLEPTQKGGNSLKHVASQ